MKEISFLHIGDIHFDSRIIGLDDRKRSVRHIETQMTLKRVLDENNDAKIVLFAGDLFDGEYNNSTIIFLCKLFSEHSDKRFFISPGNHDYLSCKCMNKLKDTIPENVHIFGDTVSYVDLENYGVRIYGAGFLSPHLFSSLLSGFKVDDNGMVNIMLMHGDVDSSSQYNPIDISDIALSNLDYLALGHKHSFESINQAGKTLYAYPGILEPRGFDECGPCGVVKGNISNGKITAQFLPCSTRRYQIIDIDITGLSTEPDIISEINSSIEENNLYRIFLTGTRNENIFLNTASYEKLVSAFYCEIYDKTQSDTNIFKFSGENTLRGKAAAILEKYIADDVFDDEELQQNVTNLLTELLCKGGNE